MYHTPEELASCSAEDYVVSLIRPRSTTLWEQITQEAGDPPTLASEPGQLLVAGVASENSWLRQEKSCNSLRQQSNADLEATKQKLLQMEKDQCSSGGGGVSWYFEVQNKRALGCISCYIERQIKETDLDLHCVGALLTPRGRKQRVHAVY